MSRGKSVLGACISVKDVLGLGRLQNFGFMRPFLDMICQYLFWQGAKLVKVKGR